MKLKYYLRGMGIGIILTAIVMGFALGGRKATMSDAEIIQRAKALGMVDGESGVLLDSKDQEGEETNDDSSTSSSPLFEEGAKIPEKEQQEVAGTGSSASEVAEEAKEGENADSEASKDQSSASLSSTKEENATASEKSSVTEDAAASGKSSVTEDAAASKSSSTSKTDTASSEASKEASTASSESTGSSSGASINTSSKTVTIPRGLGSDQVAQILVREGIIDNAVSFNKYLVDSRKDRIIRSGVKTIPAGASYEQIASIITN
ncbi:MAG: endolytic transglycosylase MltG [Butyrivibrio sp.]|nr:endolytic transglycosylase MltG [Butyrivibrio sp.]